LKVTCRFGIVTDDFGNVTGRFGNVSASDSSLHSALKGSLPIKRDLAHVAPIWMVPNICFDLPPTKCVGCGSETEEDRLKEAGARTAAVKLRDV